MYFENGHTAKATNISKFTVIYLPGATFMKIMVFVCIFF